MCPSFGSVLLGAGLAVGVVELLPSWPCMTVSPPIDFSDEKGSGSPVGRSVTCVLIAIGGGIRASSGGLRGTEAAEVVWVNPIFAVGVSKAGEERRGILKPEEEGLVGEKSSSDCCRVMGGAAPGGRAPWARK